MAPISNECIPSDSDLNSDMHLAVKDGNINKVYELLRYRPDLNEINSKQQTPLHLAVENGHYHLISHLVFHGAHIEKQDLIGNAPIHMIRVCPKQIECLEQLVLCGAHIDRKDRFGRTLLHLAVKDGEIELVKKLLRLGAYVNSTDIYGFGVLHYFAGRTSITEEESDLISVMLRENYIDVDKKNQFQQTPLFIAYKMNNIRFVRVILAHKADFTLKMNRILDHSLLFLNWRYQNGEICEIS
ncbi:serine/threonine-protein phosphatase 6 regulatory ankyrin repeat subunit B-like [Harmonia axyridis]|uniref:serine/threonine-protein phosphatase 6 regulatory ankyrin repeat subunit B-like n=1 Tax=Harmonia axyridis TaxID=115357 RepID=UPI001E274E6A|nr:serine/threonine-protein phosphatase 6 regulatory ankyrin repeat subunit B-like [Harmonia axyridis]